MEIRRLQRRYNSWHSNPGIRSLWFAAPWALVFVAFGDWAGFGLCPFICGKAVLFRRLPKFQRGYAAACKVKRRHSRMTKKAEAGKAELFRK